MSNFINKVFYGLFSLIGLFILFVCIFFYFCFSSSSDFFGDVVSQIDTGEKVVFLTFDDGPSQYTTEILDILDKYDVKASFFVIGNNVLRGDNEDILRDISRRGHEIGTHSMTHSYLNSNYEYEISESTEIIERIIGKNISLFRPPYGFRIPEVIDEAEKHNLKTIMWSSFPKDYLGIKNDVVSEVLDDLDDGVIIVLHDIDKDDEVTTEILEELILKVRARGYEFALLEDYI